jgi:adenylate cyclase class 2
MTHGDRMNKLNVEIKAKCHSREHILNVLKSHNADNRGIDHQVDTYFNCDNGRLKMREGNIENSLIHYLRPDLEGPKKSAVTMTQLKETEELKEVLKAAYGVKVIVSKARNIQFIDHIKFHIDEVEGLGSFCEIEAIDSDGSIGYEKLLLDCEKFIKLFKIKKEDLIECSYSDLLLIN